jgi:single-stranded DNA-binding protein
MSGFIASTPQLSRTESGEARMFVKVGQEHFTHNPGEDSFTQEETTFHDLIMFRRSGEKAAAQFVKGDKFIAEGYIHTYQMPDADGVVDTREEFVARRIGHDTALTRYTVDRTRAEGRRTDMTTEVQHSVGQGVKRPRIIPSVQQGPIGPTNTVPGSTLNGTVGEPVGIGR